MSKLIHYSGPAGSILLPQGYTRLAYIESNADAWFSAGIAATANTKYKIKFSVKNKGSWNMMFGRWSTCVIGIHSSMHLWINGSDVGAIKEDEICDVTASSSAVYFKSKNSITCNKVSAHPVKLAVFGGTCTSDTDNLWGYGKGRIYELKIWEGNTLIRDYVPAKNSSGVAGLLDLVDNSWHPSSTSTQFKAGPECPQGFPTSKYCQVEWLGNEKATGYVSIPYTHKADTWVDTELAFTTFYDCNTVFGACTADNSSDSFTFGCIYSGKLNCDLGAFYQADAGLVANTFYRFLVSSKTIIKDTTTYSPNKTTTTCDKTWTLFTRHNNTSYIDEGGHGKFKYMKIYEGTFNSVSGSTLKAYLIPCYRRSDMKPGFYDLVGRSFHEFVGPGASIGPSITFGYGEVVNGAVGFPQTSAYDSNIYYEPDGSAWIRVFHHNNPASNKFSSSDTFTTSFKKNDNMWWDMPKFNQITDDIYDIMVKYKTTSNSGEIKHRWVQYTNPMSGTFEDTTYNKVTKSYYYGSTIMDNFYGGFYRDTSNNAYIVHNNHYRGNWFGAIGCWSSFQDGIPGPNNTKITSGYVDVYMHIPNHPAIPHNISTGDGRNGEKNGAFHFDGTSYMEVDVGSILPANCTKYTIMMWAKADISSTCALFSQRNQVVTTGRCVLQDNTHMDYDDGVRRNFSHGVTRNNWNHYAFVRNGSNKYVYINGKLVNISSASTAGAFSPVLTIGACQTIDSGVIQQFVGDMKDIKVFDTNLDVSRIQQEM